MAARSHTFLLGGHALPAPELPPGLYLVSTPIGHLKDITLRALETLAAVSIIACEDTRVSQTLLSHYGIKIPVMTYHEYNADQVSQTILQKLATNPVALISDAGTPLISDPGHRLVQAAIAEGYTVIPVPGASAVLSAVTTSGLGDAQFYFFGFLPNKTTARIQTFETLSNIDAALVFYESPKRLAACLRNAIKIFGPDRPAVVARELTKKFETFYRGKLSDLVDTFAIKSPPKGEIVLIIGREKDKNRKHFDLDQALLSRLDRMSLKQAVEETTILSSLGRRHVYERALHLKGKK